MQRNLSRAMLVGLSVFFLTEGSFCGGSGSSAIPVVNPTSAPEQKLYVSETDLNQIAVLNPTTGALLKTIPVGKFPTKISFNYYSHSLWVANAGDNSVTKIDTNTDTVVGTVSVGTDPEWIDASQVADTVNVVDVANRGSKSITEVNASTLAVIGTFPTSGGPLTVDAYDSMVTEDNGKVEFFGNGYNKPPSSTFTVANGLQGGASTDPNIDLQYYVLFYTAYDGKVSQYSPVGAPVTSLSSVGTYTLPIGAGHIYYGSYDGYDGPIIVNSMSNEVSQIDADARKVAFTTKVGNAPSGACDHAGTVYVAISGDDAVSMIDNASGKILGTFKLQAGARPEDVAYAYSVAPPTPAPTASPTPTPAPTSTPTAAVHMYVANGSGGNVLEYTSPFSSSSTPSVNVKIGGNIWGVAVDSSYVAVEDSTGFIYIFNAPLAANASPVAQFQGPANGANLLFDSNGNLYTGTQSSGVLEYSPPFSNGSTPSKTITGDVSSFSLAMDMISDSLYVGNLGVDQIDVFASPYTGAPASVSSPGTYALATQAASLFGADAMSNAIDVYNIPVSPGDAPAYTINATNPHALAFDDSDGTLYVGDQNGSIDAFAQPLGASSTKAFSFTSGVVEPVEIAIGK